jgi:hypothetical protein
LELSRYSLDLVREDAVFILYQAHSKQLEPPSVLLLTPSSTQPSPETLEKINHAYGASAECSPFSKPKRRFIGYKRKRIMSLIVEFNAATQGLDRILEKMEEADPADKERPEAYVKSMQVKVQQILKAILRVH